MERNTRGKSRGGDGREAKWEKAGSEKGGQTRSTERERNDSLTRGNEGEEPNTAAGYLQQPPPEVDITTNNTKQGTPMQPGRMDHKGLAAYEPWTIVAQLIV